MPVFEDYLQTVVVVVEDHDLTKRQPCFTVTQKDWPHDALALVVKQIV